MTGRRAKTEITVHGLRPLVESGQAIKKQKQPARPRWVTLIQKYRTMKVYVRTVLTRRERWIP